MAESDDDEYVIKEAFCNSTSVIKTESLRDYVDYPVAKFLVVGKHESLYQCRRHCLISIRVL